MIAPADHTKLGRIIRNSIFSICGRKSHPILNKFAQVRSIREIFAVIAFLGTEEGWSVVFVALLCSYKFYATLLGAYTLTWSFIVCNQIKSFFCLPRPVEGGYVEDTENNNADKIGKPATFKRATPNTKTFDRCYDWSFPSLHVLSCTGVYMAWEHFFPGFNQAYFCILMIALSRLYFQVHHITDIVVGFLLGYIVFQIVTLTFEPVINYPYASIPMFTIALSIMILFPKQEPTDTGITDIMASIGIFLGFAGMLDSWKSLEFDGGFSSAGMAKSVIENSVNNPVVSNDGAVFASDTMPNDAFGNIFFLKLIGTMILVFPMGDLIQTVNRGIFQTIAVILGIPHFSSSVIRRFERKQGIREDKHFKQGMLIPGINVNMTDVLSKPMHKCSPYYFENMGFDIDLVERLLSNYLLATITCWIIFQSHIYLSL